uniref:USP domain-containing protein n=1 Tax=Panagrolaimus sp. JU765 TaxID=591449 RepID=A0AC34QR98_9BILA
MLIKYCQFHQCAFLGTASFGFDTIKHSYCSGCGHSYETKTEHLTDISLPLFGIDSEISLTDLLHRELTNGKNHCFGCGQESREKTRFTTLPTNLVIHFGRLFDFKNYEARKSKIEISLPTEFDLSAWIHEGCQIMDQDSLYEKENMNPEVETMIIYQLKAIIFHRGPENGGHFYTVAWDRFQSNWTLFDDVYTTKSNISFIDKREVYMAFYELVI